MKYSAQLSIRTENHARERFSDEENLYNRFKELFWRGRERVDEETFSTSDVLKKLSAAFRSSGITNLVRLSHDDVEFYLDKDIEPHDLDTAIENFGEVLHNSFDRFYEEISVVMETRNSKIDFMIELIMLRVHPIGEFPIQINFSGLPESSLVTGVEKKFNLFVNRVEQNIQKYIDLSEVTISFTKKDVEPVFERIEKDGESGDKKKGKSSEKCLFFPLYGVMLGETDVKELAGLGTPAKDKDENGNRYKYYTVNDVRFWHNNEKANHMYLTYTDPLPMQWGKCGFDWDLSYNEWYRLFEKLKFQMSIVKRPKKEWYSGKMTLAAHFNASKRISKRITISFEVYFNYSQKTSVNAKGTIYSLRVRAN